VLRIARVARLLRFGRTARGIRFFRLLTSLNRGLRSLRQAMRRRGFAYVLSLTAVVTFAGAAGMLAFEREMEGGMDTFGAAIWWTAMMMTTVGSDYFPRSAEGRVLCLLLATYAFAVWGYVTATLASYFLGRDTADGKTGPERETKTDALHAELRALREAVQAISEAQQRAFLDAHKSS
jgi:voltage-gated potassium channel